MQKYNALVEMYTVTHRDGTIYESESEITSRVTVIQLPHKGTRTSKFLFLFLAKVNLRQNLKMPGEGNFCPQFRHNQEC